MKQIRYTPDAADKLRMIKSEVTMHYGAKKASEVLKRITTSIKDLRVNGKSRKVNSVKTGLWDHSASLFVLIT